MYAIMEPYKIKSVEVLNMRTRKERINILKKADYNLFHLKAEDVTIDLLTDSGTTAMSSRQWSNLMSADDSYAGSKSFFKFEKAVKKITKHNYVLPTHQGRGAEKIMTSILGGQGKIFVSNSFFDTTRGNIELSGAKAVDLLENTVDTSAKCFSFKGNINIEALKRFVDSNERKNIGMVLLTITNNTAGGQPVSMKNIKEVSQICSDNDILLFFDACRFAENAYFIKTREEGFQDKSILKICNEMFSYVDGSLMSAKKDGLSNGGGWISLNCKLLAERFMNLLIVKEGFVTYGGMTGRELECIAQGLEEVTDLSYLQHRIGSVKCFGDELLRLGVPIVEPIGGHAVYINAKAFAPHIPQYQFPGQAIACQLYIEGGIRTCEIGSLMFGKIDANGNPILHSMELVRLAIPRRVYTTSHFDFVAKIVAQVYNNRDQLRGMEIIYQPPVLRHFMAKLKMLSPDTKTDSGVNRVNNDTLSTIL